MKEKESKIFLNCKEAYHICDKSQYEKISSWQKMKLRVHLFLCKICRKYSKNNKKLTQLCCEANIKTLKPQEKEKIKKVLESELSK